MLGPLICKQYQAAVISAKDTAKYFQHLLASVHEQLITKWTSDIEEAERNRHVTPEAMDIMGTACEQHKLHWIIEAYITDSEGHSQILC